MVVTHKGKDSWRWTGNEQGDSSLTSGYINYLSPAGSGWGKGLELIEINLENQESSSIQWPITNFI